MGNLHLNENWALAYREYLTEAELAEDVSVCDDIDSAIDTLTEGTAAFVNAYQMVVEYANLLEATAPDISGATSPTISVMSAPSSVELNTGSLLSTLLNKEQGQMGDIMKGLDKYIPEINTVTTSIRDMKPLEAIRFFIKTFIEWIQRVILYVIEKVKNLIRFILGDKTVELDKNALLLNLGKVKKIEKTSETIDAKKGPVSARIISQSDYMDLTEGITIDDILKKKDAPKNIVVTIDVSKDLLDLKTDMQHFFDLFDFAYGSNHENLFKTEDLENILQLFKASLQDLYTGHVTTDTIRGISVDTSDVNVDATRNNLIQTNANVQKLREAYTTTADRIKNIALIINTKEMTMISNMGANYTMLTSATYQNLIDILEVLPARMKEAKKLEDRLTKVQKAYEQLAKKIGGLQSYVGAVSGVTMMTGYNKKVNDLLTAAKYMTEVVALRLSAVVMYTKELKEVKDLLAMLANINTNKKGRFKQASLGAKLATQKY